MMKFHSIKCNSTKTGIKIRFSMNGDRIPSLYTVYTVYTKVIFKCQEMHELKRVISFTCKSYAGRGTQDEGIHDVEVLILYDRNSVIVY
jgi:hypothetical protein